MIPVPLILVIAGLIASARVRLSGVILGQPVSMPVLWIAAAVIVLLLAALVLILARLLLRDGLRLHPYPSTAT